MTPQTRGSLLALAFLVVGLTGTILMFALPIVSFFDWRAGDGYAVTRTEAVLFVVMVASFLVVRLYAEPVIRHGHAMRGETPPEPLPVRRPHWLRTVFFTILVAAAIWFS